MKLYISCDMEGIADVANWEEVQKTGQNYKIFSDIMTKEAASSCEGAILSGATEILVNDGHDTGRNIDHSKLPSNVQLIRGWSGHPFCMMQDINETYNAALFIGYHSSAKSNKNPLSHTLSNKRVNSITINDILADEFLINSYTAALFGVPVVFISGDEGICNKAKSINKNIKTVITKKCTGESVTSYHPQYIYNEIKENVKLALKQNLDDYKIILPGKFKTIVEFKNHTLAYRASFYPKVKQISDYMISYECKNYNDLLIMYTFVMG
jgi:D-amino peptidase